MGGGGANGMSHRIKGDDTLGGGSVYNTRGSLCMFFMSYEDIFDMTYFRQFNRCICQNAFLEPSSSINGCHGRLYIETPQAPPTSALFMRGHMPVCLNVGIGTYTLTNEI